MQSIRSKQTAAASIPASSRSELPDAGDVSPAGLREPWRTAEEFVQTVVPRWADHAVVHLLDGMLCVGGDHVAPEAACSLPACTVLHRVAVAHAPGAARPDSLLSVGEVLRPPAHSPVLISLANGETVHVPHADSFAADHLATQLGKPQCAAFLRNCAVLLVPLMAGERVLGNAMLVREPEHPAFGEDAVATLLALTRWAAGCMDTSRHCDQQTWLVDELRQGLWPDPPPRLADVDLRWRYLPNNRTVRIGGDWFDVIPLAGGRVALVIGDVMGHGVNAAMVMSRCKTMVRTLTLLGLSPAQVLRRFDRYFCELTCPYGDDHIATCLIVIYDPATQECRAANAGQIPPILVHPNGHHEIIDIPTGALIGADGTASRTCTFRASRGSILALCTDGFTALYDPDIDHALTRLRARLTNPASSLDEICESAVRGIDLEARKDDVTLLLARLLGG